MAGAYITTEAGERLLTEGEDFIVTEDFEDEGGGGDESGAGGGEDDVWIIFMLRSRRRERK